MSFSIQTKYLSKAFKQGEVTSINPGNHTYYEGDCKKEWLNAGRSLESYPFNFVINYVTDTGMNGTEVDVLQLLESHSFLEDGSPNPDAEFQRKRYLTVPEDYNNANRVELRNTGETRLSWAEMKQYIRVRA